MSTRAEEITPRINKAISPGRIVASRTTVQIGLTTLCTCLVAVMLWALGRIEACEDQCIEHQRTLEVMQAIQKSQEKHKAERQALEDERYRDLKRELCNINAAIRQLEIRAGGQ